MQYLNSEQIRGYAAYVTCSERTKTCSKLIPPVEPVFQSPSMQILQIIQEDPCCRSGIVPESLQRGWRSENGLDEANAYDICLKDGNKYDNKKEMRWVGEVREGQLKLDAPREGFFAHLSCLAEVAFLGVDVVRKQRRKVATQLILCRADDELSELLLADRRCLGCTGLR